MERDDQKLLPAAAESALRWWLDAGVDCLVDEAPRDWLRPKPAPAIASVPAATPGETGDPTELPHQLDLFQAWLRSSDRLPFSTPAAPRICPSGDPASGLMIMTDMPSAEDCAAGALISGESGQLFDRMLAAIGRDRGSVYLAALSCLRSPGGQLASEPAKQCAALARHHIGLAAPRALLLLGDNAGKALLGLPVVRARGRVHEVAIYSGTVPAIATFSPAHLLAQPTAKAHAWADLQQLMEALK